MITGGLSGSKLLAGGAPIGPRPQGAKPSRVSSAPRISAARAAGLANRFKGDFAQGIAPVNGRFPGTGGLVDLKA